MIEDSAALLMLTVILILVGGNCPKTGGGMEITMRRPGRFSDSSSSKNKEVRKSERGREKESKRERERKRKREKEIEIESKREREKERERENERKRDRERVNRWGNFYRQHIVSWKKTAAYCLRVDSGSQPARRASDEQALSAATN